MASATLKATENQGVEEWLDQALKLILRVIESNTPPIAKELQDELIGDLERLLLSGEKPAEVSGIARHIKGILLLSLGEINTLQGNWLAATQYLKQAKPLLNEVIGKPNLRKSDSPSSVFDLDSRLLFVEARAELVTGKKSVEDGAWQQGLQKLKKALHLFQATDDTDGKANASLSIGDVYRNFGDYEIAQSYYWDAVRFFRRAENKRGEAMAQMRYGTALIDLQKYREASPYLTSAHKLFSEDGDTDQLAIAGKWLDLVKQMEKNAGVSL